MPPENEISNSPLSQEEIKPNTAKSVIDLDKTASKADSVSFKKSKAYTLGSLLLLVVLLALFTSYYLGSQNSKTAPVIEKKSENKDTTQPNVKNVGLNEEVTVNSGVTITLDSAKYDKIYESQKQEQLNLYKNSASQSAYLQSDYFKQSNLILSVNLVNNTKKSVSYNPSSFRLKDSDDVQYVSSGNEGDKTFVSGLNPSEKTKLNLSYIVPSNQKSFKLIYENAIIEFSIK